MDFINEVLASVKICFSKYATFSGRAKRPEYWHWFLFVILATVITTLISNLLYNLFTLAVLLPNMAVVCRRLHDIGRSGWWMLIGFIPVIGWGFMIYWLVQPSQEGSNKYDETPA